MSDVYRIADWDATYEKASSRRVDQCSYVLMPNKHDSMGLLNLLEMDEGLKVLGMFHLIVQFCSRQKMPREGWITTNGRADGRPVAAIEFARRFRRAKEDVELCFKVCSLPEIGWIEKHAPGAQTTPNIAKHLETTVVVPETTTNSGEHPETSEVVPETMPNSGGMSIKKGKERKERTESSREEKDAETLKLETESDLIAEHPETTAVVAETTQDVLKHPETAEPADLVYHAEAKQVLGQLAWDVFGERMPTIWPNDVEHWLDTALPITGAELKLVNWFYRLPVAHEIFRCTKRKQSFPALVEQLRREIQKIKSSRAQIGLNGFITAEVAEKDDWPEGARAMAFELWGEEKKLPPRFRELPTSAQDELKAALRQSVTTT